MSGDAATADLSIVLPAWNEGPNLRILLPQIKDVVEALDLEAEILVIDNHSADATTEICAAHGAQCIQQAGRGFGAAIVTGFHSARGGRVVTMDADLSHPPAMIATLWNARDAADVLIASRFVAGGAAQTTWFRHLLSRVLNLVFSILFRLDVRDLSSGFRLYRREQLLPLRLQSRDYDVLEEILLLLDAAGSTIAELPMRYGPRGEGLSHASVFKFGISYLKTIWRLRRLVFSRPGRG